MLDFLCCAKTLLLGSGFFRFICFKTSNSSLNALVRTSWMIARSALSKSVTFTFRVNSSLHCFFCTRALKLLMWRIHIAIARFARYQSEKCFTLSQRLVFSESTLTICVVTMVTCFLTSGSLFWRSKVPSLWSWFIGYWSSVFQRKAGPLIQRECNNSWDFTPREASSAGFCFDAMWFHCSTEVLFWISWTLLATNTWNRLLSLLMYPRTLFYLSKSTLGQCDNSIPDATAG